jgi:hypothetical protein
MVHSVTRPSEEMEKKLRFLARSSSCQHTCAASRHAHARLTPPAPLTQRSPSKLEPSVAPPLSSARPTDRLLIHPPARPTALLPTAAHARAHLPHGVRVLARLDRGLEDGAVEPVADVEDHDGAVVAADGEEGGVLGVEVEAHDPRLGGEGVLGVAGILEGEAAHQARTLRKGTANVG